MIEPYASAALHAAKKARGHIDRVIKMMEEKKYCMDVIQQSNAAIGILRNANNSILESHLHTCGKKLASLKLSERKKFIQELIRACTISSHKR